MSKNVCQFCGIKGWDDLHALFECDGLLGERKKLKISDRLCLFSGHQTIYNIREEIQNIINMKGKEIEFGELIIKLKKQWETKNIVQGGSFGVDHH